MRTAKIIYGDGTTDRKQFSSYSGALLYASTTAREKGTIVRGMSWMGGKPVN